MVEMSGASVPTELLNRLDGASESEARIIGMDFSIELATQLLEVSAPGLHLFTLNRHKGALQIAEEVGLVR
jgi:methylenetetrahydrofolate reductase (NADPH)